MRTGRFPRHHRPSTPSSQGKPSRIRNVREIEEDAASRWPEGHDGLRGRTVQETARAASRAGEEHQARIWQGVESAACVRMYHDGRAVHR